MGKKIYHRYICIKEESMPAVVVALVVAVAFFLGYRFYSKYLAEKVYALDKSNVTPAHEFEDGVDYVPTNKHVLFGHHFT
jgi:carbon starvation protein